MTARSEMETQLDRARRDVELARGDLMKAVAAARALPRSRWLRLGRRLGAQTQNVLDEIEVRHASAKAALAAAALALRAVDAGGSNASGGGLGDPET